MQPDVGAAVSWLRSKSFLAGLALVTAAALVVTFLPDNALAQCAGGSACVERQGTDSTSVESNQNLQGGDGVAGGQVIGVGEGSGDVIIDADNDSEFSNADGGDAQSDIEMRGGSTTGTTVNGSNVQVTADSNESVQIDQGANPRNQISGEFAPLAPATGESVFSGTATTGVDQDANAAQSPDITHIAAPARAMATVIDEGDRRVVLRSEGSATSGDAIAGGQVIAVIATTGETTIIATNRSVFANAKGGEAEAEIDLSAAEDAGLSVAPSPSNTSLETSAGGNAVVGQTATPHGSIVVDGDGEVEATAEAGVVQSATLESSPRVLTVSGEQTTSGTIIQRGDSVAEQKVDVNVSGGDAIAGGQVIGLSGVEGNVTIAASNNSRYATARGGDARSKINSTATAAPRVSLVGGNTASVSEVTANVQAGQSAAPEVSLAVSQSSGGAGSSTGAGTSPGNTGTATGSANVQQTASTTSSPTSLTELTAQP